MEFFGDIIWFLAYYVFILIGFKILKIKEIQKFKVIVFLFVIFLISLFLSSVALIIFKDIASKFTVHLIYNSILFLATFLLLKHYFLLSGKKLWQLFLYLIFFNFVFSIVGIMIGLYMFVINA